MKFTELAKKILQEGTNTKPKFGASFNCIVGNEEIGGGAEGYTTTDFVGNTMKEVVDQAMDVESFEKGRFEVTTDHALVGRNIDIGDKVVAVVVYANSQEPCGVIFTNPMEISQDED